MRGGRAGARETRGVELELADADLLRLAARGDDQAFAVLVERHAPALYRAALSFTRSHLTDAEDLVQETLVAAFRGAKGYAGRASVRTWMLQILSHEAHRAWRRGRHRRATLSLDGGASSSSSSWRGDATGPIHDDALATPSGSGRVDHRLDIADILEQLTPPHREILVMREIWDMSYDEIAAALNVPRGTVESRLSRARAAFRKRFEAEENQDRRER